MLRLSLLVAASLFVYAAAGCSALVDSDRYLRTPCEVTVSGDVTWRTTCRMFLCRTTGFDELSFTLGDSAQDAGPVPMIYTTLRLDAPRIFEPGRYEIGNLSSGGAQLVDGARNFVARAAATPEERLTLTVASLIPSPAPDDVCGGQVNGTLEIDLVELLADGTTVGSGRAHVSIVMGRP